MNKVKVSEVMLKDVKKAGNYLYKAIKSSPTYEHQNINKDKIERVLADTIYDPLKIAYIMFKDKKIIGMIGGYVTTNWFSSDRILFDMGIFIDEEYRGNGTSKPLFMKWFEYAEKIKVNEICFSCTADKKYYAPMYELFTKKFDFELQGVYLRKRR